MPSAVGSFRLQRGVLLAALLTDAEGYREAVRQIWGRWIFGQARRVA